MRIVLHIGLHKTGSTSTYDLFVANRERFPADVSLFHNQTPEIEPLKSAAAAFAEEPGDVNGAALRDEFLKLVARAEDQGATTLLISSAGLAGAIPKPWNPGGQYEHLPELLRTLIHAADGHEVETVVVTRDDDAWIESLYRHHLRVRGVRFTRKGFRALFAPDFGFDALVARLAPQGAKLHRVRFEDDVRSRLGPGFGVLTALGINDAELADWQPVEKRKEGVPRESVAFVSQPWTFVLSRRLRREIVRRSAARRTGATGG